VQRCVSEQQLVQQSQDLSAACSSNHNNSISDSSHPNSLTFGETPLSSTQCELLNSTTDFYPRSPDLFHVPLSTSVSRQPLSVSSSIDCPPSSNFGDSWFTAPFQDHDSAHNVTTAFAAADYDLFSTTSNAASSNYITQIDGKITCRFSAFTLLMFPRLFRTRRLLSRPSILIFRPRDFPTGHAPCPRFISVSTFKVSVTTNIHFIIQSDSTE
jgi:hypothetical protein